MSAPSIPPVAPATPPSLASQMAVLATIPDPPAAVAALIQGTIIEGIVVALGANGLVTLRTRYGALAITTNANPPLGSRIALEVRVAGYRLQTVILRVDPQPGGRQPPPPPPALPPTAPAAGSDRPAVVLARDSTVAAILVPPTAARPAPEPPGDAGAPALPPGAAGADGEIALRIREIAVPPPGGSRPGEPAGAAGEPMPATPAAPASSAMSEAGAFTGTVISRTPAGQPVIASPLGTLILRVAADLPDGTVVVMVPAPPDPPPRPTTTPPGPGAAHQALFQVTRGWPSLAAAMTALQRTAPDDAERLRPHIPQVGRRLATGLAETIARLTGPEAESWLMPILRPALARAGLGELATRLESDWRQRLELAAEPPNDGWRSLFLPVLDDPRLRQIAVHLHHQPREPAASIDAGTRFAIDFDLDRFGTLQLDGFVRWPRLDLVLRSHAPLPAWVEEGVAAVYDAMRANGAFTGRIAFQSMASYPVAPMEQSVHEPASLWA